jgi:hypothetical protein
MNAELRRCQCEYKYSFLMTRPYIALTSICHSLIVPVLGLDVSVPWIRPRTHTRVENSSSEAPKRRNHHPLVVNDPIFNSNLCQSPLPTHTRETKGRFDPGPSKIGLLAPSSCTSYLHRTSYAESSKDTVSTSSVHISFYYFLSRLDSTSLTR